MQKKSTFIPFKERKDYDWSDITPLTQDINSVPVLKIKYPAEYDEVMSYFRAICHKQEISPRVFALTGEVITYSPGSFTAWDVRKKCIEQLKLDPKEDLKFCSAILARGNEKCFQLWEHRRWLITQINDPCDEIDVLEKEAFSSDNKNYHAWIYRKWLVENFKLYEKDLPKVEKHIDEDIGNNSAWNFRYFIKSREIVDKDSLAKELKYTKEKILIDPNNEASWNYLNGWFKQYSYKCFNQGGADIAVPPHLKRFNYLDFSVEEFVIELLKFNEDCRFGYATLLQINLIRGDKPSIEKAIEISELLASKYDKIRYVYWLWVKKNITSDFEQILAS